MFDDLNLRIANPYGFKATFNPTFPTKSGQGPLLGVTLALGLNQGPIVLMIENFRSGLIWRLMRHCQYFVRGLRRAGFTGGWLGAQGSGRLCLSNSGEGGEVTSRATERQTQAGANEDGSARRGPLRKGGSPVGKSDEGLEEVGR